MPLYSFTKGVQPFYPDTIRLVKNGGVVSKQTFIIQVTAEASAVDNQAMYGVDYDIGVLPVQSFTMTPDQQYIPIPIDIYDNGAVEGTLQAILVTALTPNSPASYNTPHNPTTKVNILNNYGELMKGIM